MGAFSYHRIESTSFVNCKCWEKNCQSLERKSGVRKTKEALDPSGLVVVSSKRLALPANALFTFAKKETL